VTTDHDQHSGVTAILKNLDWPSLEHRRQNQRLIMRGAEMQERKMKLRTMKYWGWKMQDWNIMDKSEGL